MNVFWHRFTEFSTLRALFTKISDFLAKMDRKKLENYLKGGRFEVEEILPLLENELKGSKALLIFEDFQKTKKEIVDFFASFKDLITDTKTIIMGRSISLFYSRKDTTITKTVREMALPGLDKESSIKLLKHRKIEKDLDRLYSLTQGHPLLLELVTPETMVEAVEFIREDIIRKLNKQERKALEVASVFRHPFPGRAVIDGTDYDTIDNLVDKSLMQRSSEVYDLHDVIKDTISARVPEKQEKNYHTTAAEYYENEKGEPAVIEAIYHFIKADNQGKAVALGIENGERTINKGFTKEVLDVIEEVKEKGTQKPEWTKILFLKGESYRWIGEYEKTLECNKKALDLSRELKNKKLSAKACRNMGEVHVARNDYDKARDELQSAVKISKEIKDARGTAGAYFWLGKVSWYTGRADDARSYLEDSLILSEKLGDEKLKAMIYNDLGAVYDLKGEHEASFKHAMKALEYFERVDDKYELARAYNNLGGTCEEMNDYKKALEWYKKCVKTARNAGLVRLVGYGLTGIADCYANLGEKLEKAMQYTDEAIEIFGRLGEKKMVGSSHGTYGILYHKQKEWVKASEHFEKSIKIDKNVKDSEGVGDGSLNYGKMLADKGDKEKAKKQFQKSIDVYEKLGNKKKVEEVKKELEKL